MNAPKFINIFVSSPGDLAEERGLAKALIERLNRKERYQDRFAFRAMLYEDYTPGIVGDYPQGSVNKFMITPDQCDIFLCMLWNRMGTPLIEEKTGEKFSSGTEYEFKQAYRANQSTGRPVILLYRSGKTAPPSVRVDPDQLKLVNDFFQSFEGQQASYRGLYATFSNNDDFQRILPDDLERVIDKYFQDAVPESENRLNPDEVDRTIRTYTEHMLGIRYREKYNPDYYARRPDIVGYFEEFLAGNKTVMVLTGMAGTGKSSFVSDISTQPLDNTVVWLQDCAVLQMDSEMPVDDYIHRQLKLPENLSLQAAFKDLEKKNPTRKIVLVFDAINEFTDPAALLSKLSAFVIRIQAANIKVLITCRVPQWNNLGRHLKVPPAREFLINGKGNSVSTTKFNDAEIAEIYERYRKFFDIATPFADLAPRVQKFIEEPLFLKLMAIAYKENKIPASLTLETVFERYVNYCLKLDPNTPPSEASLEEIPEYMVLRRAIQLMYELARRDLNLALLRQDSKAGPFVAFDLAVNTPYTNLVKEGLFSERIDQEQARKIEVVYITYERVFEYLLSRYMIPSVSLETIEELLDRSKLHAFMQLRGAAELAVSFALVNKLISPTIILDLAKKNRPESRQFLTDVIHTIYSTGYREMAIRIIDSLIKSDLLEVNLLAVQAAYQLGLNDHLIRYVMDDRSGIREFAALFIYQNWNSARLNGHLADGYVPLRAIADRIRLNIRHPEKMVQAFTALASITVTLMSHIIDDMESLAELLLIWQNLVHKIRGIDPRPTRSLVDKLAKTAVSVGIDMLSQVLGRMMNQNAALDPAVLSAAFSDVKAQRAFMDTAVLANEPDLLKYEDQLKTMLDMENLLVPTGLTSVFTYHLYANPAEHIPFLQNIYFELDPETCRFPLRSRFTITFALLYSALCRIMRELPVADEHFEAAEENFVDVWQFFKAVDENGIRQIDKEKITDANAREDLRQLFLARLNAEALQQESTGKIEGSQFLKRFLEALESVPFSDEDIQFLVKMVEVIAYLGKPEFSVKTLLSPYFRPLWEGAQSDAVLTSLASIRSFYQEEVDSLLAEYEKAQNTDQLLRSIRMISVMPNSEEILKTNANLWLIAVGIEPAVTKITGNIMFDLINVSNVREFINRMTRTLISMLFDFDVINIAYMEWGLAHNAAWDDYDQWHIPRSLANEKPDIHQYWREVIQEFINRAGYGSIHET